MMKHVTPVLLLLLWSAPVLADDLAEVTAKEYHAAAYFKEALEHPKIQKLKSRQAQISAVAKDLKLKPKQLEQAIEKVEALGEGEALAKKVESVIRSATEKSRVKGHVLDV